MMLFLILMNLMMLPKLPKITVELVATHIIKTGQIFPCSNYRIPFQYQLSMFLSYIGFDVSLCVFLDDLPATVMILLPKYCILCRIKRKWKKCVEVLCFY